MEITASRIALTSSHERVERHIRRESLQVTVETPRRFVRDATETEGELSLSPQARRLQPVSVEAKLESANFTASDALEISLIKAILERLTGREIRLFRPEDIHDAQAEGELANNAEALREAHEQENRPEQRLGWSLSYDRYESHYEAERATVSAEGVIQTADGREITFSVEVAMSREFLRESALSLRAGDAVRLKDPLVINFGGHAAELTVERFAFDLDLDGRTDQVRFVGPGSGFLALDRNDDGTINDGSELFGARSGDGFRELTRFDEDGNGWIDESDSIYDRLRIWSRDVNGNDRLVGLGDKGIGALYLGHIESAFALKDADNALQGAVRSTGLYVRENGSAGTVQQLDLVV